MIDAAVGQRVSRRSVLGAGLGLAAGLGLTLTGCANSSEQGGSTEKPSKPTVKPKADGDIAWLTWSEYVPPEVVKGFEDSTA